VKQHIAIGFHIPMAGLKSSGLGVEQAEEGLAEYTQFVGDRWGARRMSEAFVWNPPPAAPPSEDQAPASGSANVEPGRHSCSIAAVYGFGAPRDALASLGETPTW
jgi:hypothetical protein